MMKPAVSDATITTSNPLGHGLQVGEAIELWREYVPWYKRFWRWITRYKPTVYYVTEVTATTITVTTRKGGEPIL